MAKYNREFLLPYLKSLCAIEFAGYTLFGIGQLEQEEIDELRLGKHDRKNPKPLLDIVPIFTFDRVGFFIFGVLFLLYVFKSEDASTYSSGTMITLAVIGLIPALISLLCIVVSTLKNVISTKKYSHEMEIYREIEAENEENKKHDISISEKRKAIIDAEYEQVINIRNEVYNVNVIPRKNRDISAAMYLYDLFSSSQKNDLDLALDQYDEDELEDELIDLVHQQLELTNKQNRMDALKDRELPPEERQSAVMQRKLEQMNVSDEEKSIYSQMIAGIDAVMNFFAETQCLQ